MGCNLSCICKSVGGLALGTIYRQGMVVYAIRRLPHTDFGISNRCRPCSRHIHRRERIHVCRAHMSIRQIRLLQIQICTRTPADGVAFHIVYFLRTDNFGFRMDRCTVHCRCRPTFRDNPNHFDMASLRLRRRAPVLLSPKSIADLAYIRRSVDRYGSLGMSTVDDVAPFYTRHLFRMLRASHMDSSKYSVCTPSHWGTRNRWCILFLRIFGIDWNETVYEIRGFWGFRFDELR